MHILQALEKIEKRMPAETKFVRLLSQLRKAAGKHSTTQHTWLCGLVEHARVDRGSNQVVRGAHGVDVAREVQIEVLHRHDLRIAAAGRSALDAKRRACNT